MRRPGRVVWVAQQISQFSVWPRRTTGTRKRFGQRVQVNSTVAAEWGFHHAASIVRDERVEGWIHGRIDDDGVTAVRDQTQHLDDPEHDVGNNRGAADL